MHPKDDSRPASTKDDDARLNREQESEKADALYKDRKKDKYRESAKNAGGDSTKRKPEPQPANNKKDNKSGTSQAPQLNSDKKREQDVDPQEDEKDI